MARVLDVDADGLTSMADLETVLADPERIAQVQQAIDQQAEHFNMTGLDLGFCYESPAILSDGLPPVSPDPVSVYVPSTTPGCRLPHAWLDRQGQKISTLDLLHHDRFLVLTFTAEGEELFLQPLHHRPDSCG
ncbi:MAG: hypothetical protein O3A63_08665 [Proteobacteria bacterium]|nr:hypothetical protein [Pseudomonadota bacterium]